MNLFNTVKSFFKMAYLNEEMENEFLLEESKKIVKYMKFILFIIPSFQVYNIIYTLIYTNFRLKSVASRVYMTFYIIMIIVSLIFIILGVKRYKSDYKYIINLQFVYSFFYILWITGITIYDQRVGQNVSQFITAMLFVSLLVYLKPIQAISIFFIPEIILIISLNIFDKITGSQHYGVIISTICIAFSSTFISCYRYSREREIFYEKKIILYQKNEIEEKNRLLNSLLEHDALTGLYNRRFFDENIEKIMKEIADVNGDISIFMMDIDNFKLFNDFFGHQKGDDILKIVSQTVKLHTKNGYPIRYGGEEICVIIPFMNKDLAKIQGDEFVNSVRNLNIATSIKDKNLTISVGIHTEKVFNYTKWRNILGKSDKALYYVKNNRKDNFAFYDDISI